MSNHRPSLLFRWFHDLRPEPAHAIDFVYTSARAAARQPANWILPAMGLLLVLPVAAVTNLSLYASDYPTWSLAGRIILVDYMLFFFGWLCGWNNALRWRRTRGLMEELVTTPVGPAVVARMLGAGALSVWTRLFIYMAIVEGFALAMIFVFPVFSEGIPPNPLLALAGCMLAVGASFCLSTLLAWFHLESLRIAYMMFAVAALPRLRLGQYALTNFFSIGMLVFLLTGLGSMISGPAGLAVASYFEYDWNSRNALDPGLRILAGQIGAIACAFLGLIIVGFLKRITARNYRREFIRHFLYFIWWGAGETDQPGQYPMVYRQFATQWIATLDYEERPGPSGVPPPPAGPSAPSFRPGGR